MVRASAVRVLQLPRRNMQPGSFDILRSVIVIEKKMVARPKCFTITD